MRASPIRVALCESPGVPSAPCVTHPVSMEDVECFHRLAPALDGFEEAAHRAARALHVVGRPTHALALLYDEAPPPNRRTVWRTGAAATRRVPSQYVLLLATKLLEELAGAWWLAGSLDGLGITLPPGHYSEWDRDTATEIGAVAWRAAVARGLSVTATCKDPGARLHVNPTTVGAAYATLVDPFESLGWLARAGIELAAVSPEAVLLEARCG
ncbi:MAG: hypothetical protein Q8P18_20455 [Pseudomonadota bacterium]|nr:hypothetical protein [Pseudomonadota bacterium]